MYFGLTLAREKIFLKQSPFRKNSGYQLLLFLNATKGKLVICKRQSSDLGKPRAITGILAEITLLIRR